MAKILFINPVVREEDDPKHVPYGMALLAAIASQSGHAVQVYDANAWRLGDNALKTALQADAWDVVAIGGITVDNCRPIIEAGAQFVAVADGVWNHSDGPGVAVKKFNAIFDDVAAS